MDSSSEDSESDSQMSSTASSSSCGSIECIERHHTNENKSTEANADEIIGDQIHSNGHKIDAIDIKFEASMDYQIQILPSGAQSDSSNGVVQHKSDQD